MALDFYHGHGSAPSWRVFLALEHKKVPYNLKVLSFDKKETTKPEFVALNPRHTVPTIVDDGFALWESLAILEYLDERFPSAPRLFPVDMKERTRIRRLIRELEGYFYEDGIAPIAVELFFKEGGEPDMAKVKQAGARLREEIDYFAREVRGKFLGGEAPCAADFVLYPYLAYAGRVQFRKPEAGLGDGVPGALADYKKRVEALPYFDKTFPPHWR
jgi:glutathione S-transferase